MYILTISSDSIVHAKLRFQQKLTLDSVMFTNIVAGSLQNETSIETLLSMKVDPVCVNPGSRQSKAVEQLVPY